MSEILDLHVPFAAWLKTLPVVFRRSRPDMPTSEMPGEPDFSIYRGPIAVLHIELKTEKGKLSKDQIKRHAEYAAIGQKVHVARTVEHAQALVLEWMEAVKRWGVFEVKERPTVKTLMIGHTEYEEYEPGKLRKVGHADKPEIQPLIRRDDK